MAEIAKTTDIKLNIHAESCNAHLAHIVKDIKFVLKNNPVALLKTVKNTTEIKGLKDCNVRDCVVLMRYFSYLEMELRFRDHTITEYTGARDLRNMKAA